MRRILTILFTCFALCSFAQQKEKFNLDFEERKTPTTLATGWFQWGTYHLSMDSLYHSGNLAGKITSDEAGTGFGCITYHIPAHYKGKKITLEGYMKIKDVSGHAGLLLRVDGNGKSLAFDNMQDQQIKGTKDWQKYSITLDYPAQADAIYVAGMLSGKGEAWFDDFVVTIDGHDIQTSQEIQKEISKAQKDNAFDRGSSINLSTLSSQPLVDLELLGRIWGFLKYHHPEIAKGNYNWDYELFRFLPKYLASTDTNNRDDILVDWIASLGDIKPCQHCLQAPSEAHLKPDFRWIDRQDDKLKKALLHVYSHRTDGEHYYISLAANAGNPVFKNEKAYGHMSYPDDGYRLLALYRYWNMITYFFPYKYLTDKEWDTTLREHLPLLVHAKDELAYELALLRLIADIHDTHANLGQGADKIEEWKGKNYAPFEVRFTEDKLTVTNFPYPDCRENTSLAIGDVIQRIDGKKITTDMVAERTPYYPASNIPARLRHMANDLLRSNNESIEIEFITAKGKKHFVHAIFNPYSHRHLEDMTFDLPCTPYT